MPKHLALLAAALFTLVLSHPLAAQEGFDQEAYEAWAREFLDNLHPQEGRITLPDARVTLNVPEGFYYLSAEETAKVLVEAWGNPPEASQSLGMLMPGAMTPLIDAAVNQVVEVPLSPDTVTVQAMVAGRYQLERVTVNKREILITDSDGAEDSPLSAMALEPGEVIYAGKLVMRFDGKSPRYEVLDESDLLERWVWSNERYAALKPRYKKRLMTLEPVKR